MSDPQILDRILESCSIRFRDVLCPNKGKVAKIAAAKSQGEDEDWSVIEKRERVLRGEHGGDVKRSGHRVAEEAIPHGADRSESPRY